MRKLDLVEYTLPNWALSALINSDSSGLTGNEEKILNKFVKENLKEYRIFFAIDAKDLGFCSHNDIDNYAGDCSLVSFDVGKWIDE